MVDTIQKFILGGLLLLGAYGLLRMVVFTLFGIDILEIDTLK